MGQEFRINIDDAVRRYADMVYRLAMLNTRDKYEAEDVFQEVFLKLFKHQDSINCEEHLKAWLIRVTVNQCRSLAVTVWNKRRVSLDAVPETAVEDETADYSEVYEAVRELPQKYREVIHLFYYEELQIKEIAQILERNEATIKTQLARGRKLLEKNLKGAFEDGRI